MKKEKWKKLGFEIEYDYEVFSTFDELKAFILSEHTYNYLDASAYLRDGEKIVYAYSRSKIVIL